MFCNILADVLTPLNLKPNTTSCLITYSSVLLTCVTPRQCCRGRLEPITVLIGWSHKSITRLSVWPWAHTQLLLAVRWQCYSLKVWYRWIFWHGVDGSEKWTLNKICLRWGYFAGCHPLNYWCYCCWLTINNLVWWGCSIMQLVCSFFWASSMNRVCSIWCN